MSLNEGQRLIKPDQVKLQVNWDKLDGVVVLGLAKNGEQNVLHMSSVTINELTFLSQQLQAHINYLLGPMNEQ